MLVLGISELSDYLEFYSNHTYIYSTANQIGNISGSVRMSVRFDCMNISKSFNRIRFSKGKDEMVINNVQRVIINDDCPCIGVIFDIVFEVHNNNKTTKRTITMIME